MDKKIRSEQMNRWTDRQTDIQLDTQTAKKYIPLPMLRDNNDFWLDWEENIMVTSIISFSGNILS